jgi:hypothetical protein
MIAGANGQTPKLEPKTATPSVEGAFKDIQSADLELVKQDKVFDALQEIPAAQNTDVVRSLISDSGHLPPIFLYEIARRLWEMDRRDEAFEWFAVAVLRSAYDSGRCVDISGMLANMMLPRIAGKVWIGTRQSALAYGAAGLRALARPDVFSDAVSPWWVCAKSDQAIKARREKRSIEQSDWLRPKDQWERLQVAIRAEFTKVFTASGKPEGDPVPKPKKPYKITNVGVAEVSRFVWLDEQRLLFAELRPTLILRQWKADAPEQELAQFKGPWCAGRGVMSFRVKSEPGSGKSLRETFVVGEPGKTAEQVVEFESQPKYAEIMHIDPPWTSVADPRRQSPFDCRWVKSDFLSGPNKDANWLPLLPGHGFLSFPGPVGQRPDKILHYRTENSSPTELPISAKDVAANGVQYFPFKNAYFISRRAEFKEPIQGQACLPVWWFFPEQVRTEEVCVPIDGVNVSAPAFWPSRVGMLRVIKSRSVPYNESQPGGIYLTSPDGRVEKIFESGGNIAAVAVSPEGCRIAIRSVRTAPWSHSFDVMDLCAQDRSPGANIAR